MAKQEAKGNQTASGFRKTRRRGFHPGQPGDLVEIDTVSIFTMVLSVTCLLQLYQNQICFAYAYKSNSSANGKIF